MDVTYDTRTQPGVKRRKRRQRKLVLLLAAIVLVGSGAAFGVYLLAANTDIVNRLSPNMTVSGTVELPLKDMVNWGTACEGRRGYDDLKIGAPVVVTDAAGKTVGIGQIDTAKEIGGQCVLSFRIADVPKGSDFYGVAVSHRGTVQYSADEIAKPIELSLT
jgi:hypothetical protein